MSNTLALVANRDYPDAIIPYLAQIEENPFSTNVEDILADIISIRNASQWLIGDVLVYLRFRTNFENVKAFAWDGKLTDELAKYVRDRYRVSLDQGERRGFLIWDCLRFEKFWILFEKNEARIYQRLDRVGDQDFQYYLEALTARLKAQLGYRNLKNFFQTSWVFPFPERRPYSWSWHYNQLEYAAGKLVDLSLRGEERLEALSRLIVDTAEEFENNGQIKAQQIREAIDREHDLNRGFSFYTPIPASLNVTNHDTNQGIEFLRLTGENREAAMALIKATKVWQSPNPLTLTLKDEKLYDTKGRLVATLCNLDDPTVAEALMWLSEKMDWKIKID